MSEATPKIYKAICDVMADIGAVGKNQKNQQQGFMFRGIDAVMNAINPALLHHPRRTQRESENHKRIHNRE